MIELIRQDTVKARKTHRCSYCNRIIEKGEKYIYQLCKYDGDLYEWKGHTKCCQIAGEIIDYVDPCEGMTSEEFDEGCHDVCRSFICPDCEKWDEESGSCDLDESYCIDKLAKLFETHELYREPVDEKHLWGDIWGVRKKD